MLLSALVTGCPSRTLFQSSFNSQSVGGPPATNQAVGTGVVSGVPPGNVVIVGPVAGSSVNWVQVTRPIADPATALTMWQGNFSGVGGDGTGFIASLMIPAACQGATVSFLTGPTSSPQSAEILHVDFFKDPTSGADVVRINDDTIVPKGKFPRDQVFTLSVGMTISASSAVAHVTLYGPNQNASGSADYPIQAVNLARQWGAFSLWIGSQWMGSFDATDILVTSRP
jgi:hypothetical protein